MKQVVLITGASSGIGKATALAFAKAGYEVALADRDESAGERVAGEIAHRGGKSLFVTCDVASEEDVAALVARTVDHFGQLDVAFNNAGIEGEQAPTADCPVENWDRVMAVNLRGLWLCMRAEIPHMLKGGGGAIVNCASVAGLVGLAGIPAYVAAKHGVVGLTRAAALDYATRGIRVNAVCPGAIHTPMLDRFMGEDSGRAQILAAEPVGRIGKPEEVASAVLWLCSDGAAFTTGQALAVDGGWTAR
jgi:NAD(P)-dependent dehydrogenase (short-subunit alcohol dehydrogenase family)